MRIRQVRDAVERRPSRVGARADATPFHSYEFVFIRLAADLSAKAIAKAEA
jgi:hypothetical protein